MNTKTTIPPLVLSVVTLAAILVVLLAMRATNAILAPILLAFVLAITTTPLLDWFIKKGAPSWLALILTILLIVIFILGLVWLVGNSVQNFSESISDYQQRFMEIEQELGGFLTKLGVDVNNLGADQSTSPQGLLQLAASFVGGIVSGLSNFGLIILTTIFFLVEALAMPRKVQNVAQESSPGVRQFLQLFQELRQYMAINAGVGLLAAVINVILLTIMGIEFAVLWGILSFFLSFVPNVGFIISVIPPALMALLQYGPREMLIVIVAYIVINFLVDNVVKPRFIEKGVNISVLQTFLALILWAWVLGPTGAILAVPMAIIIQAVFNSRPETRWLGYLMGSGSEPFNPGAELGQDKGEQVVS
jgi:AI-2 transport protein TqsA